MEEIDSYNERVFITPESNKTNIVVQMYVDDDAVSLGSQFEDAREFYAQHGESGGYDMLKYGFWFKH